MCGTQGGKISGRVTCEVHDSLAAAMRSALSRV
jgi:hypothetical protein